MIARIVKPSFEHDVSFDKRRDQTGFVRLSNYESVQNICAVEVFLRFNRKRERNYI